MTDYMLVGMVGAAMAVVAWLVIVVVLKGIDDIVERISGSDRKNG